jgi:hypothetical protein
VKRPYTRKVSTKEPNVINVMEGADVQDNEVYVPPSMTVARIHSEAQAYANRVWRGQSDDLPVFERLDRVRAALAGQSMDTDGVDLDGHAL